jgi:hypothetical protein
MGRKCSKHGQKKTFVSVCNLERKILVGTKRHESHDNFKTVIEKSSMTVCTEMKWLRMILTTIHYEHSNETPGSIKPGNSLTRHVTMYL